MREVVMWVEEPSGERDPVAVLVAESTLTRPQIDAALRYRTAYPIEGVHGCRAGNGRRV